MAELPALTSAMSFDAAATAVLTFLRTQLPLGIWHVSRYDGTSQVMVAVDDVAYGLAPGDSLPWEDTLCAVMTAGQAPHMAPDVSAVPALAATPAVQNLPIGAYVGVPIRWSDGALFGTLCGLDPAVQPAELAEHEPLLTLLGGLLSMILAADHARTQTEREVERVALLAETDPLTGLLNRRGWSRFLELEEQRYQRFGDPAAVVVLDLDRLKHVNDTRGHAAGDDYIVAAGQALRRAVRDHDVVARLGGDEFGVVAAGAGPEQTSLLVERIGAALDQVGVEGSIGQAPYTIVSGFPGAWEKADAAMYDEKRRRKGNGPPAA